MPPNVYDKASRFAAKVDPAGFLGWLLGLPAGGFAFRGWLDTRGVPAPGGGDSIGDTVARLDDPATHGTPWAVAVEFQAEPDPAMFGRLLRYLAELWQNVKPDGERGSRYHVGAAVVNLTGNGFASRDMRWPAAGLATHLGVVERNLERERADELLAGIESGRWSRCLLPWVALMLGGNDPGLVDRWKVQAEAEPDARRRSAFGSLALAFSVAAGCQDLWREKLKGWNVKENQVVLEWQTDGNRDLLVSLGTKRFGRGPTEGQQTALDAIKDSARLAALVERLFEVNSWDELFPKT